MPYQAIVEAREAAEKQAKDNDLIGTVRLGLQMARETEERKAAQAALARGGSKPEEPKQE